MARDDAQTGDEEAFRAIYAGEFEYVWRTLRRLGVRDRDMEDLAHDVFVVVYRTLGRYDRERPVRPWLFGIAFRVVSDYRRRARFSREIPVDRDDAVSGAPAPDEEVERRDRRALVLAALEELPMPQRAVFVSHELEGLTVPEIAAGLSVPENTCYSRLRLARRKFAEAVRRLRDGQGA
ncbi:MAG: RNA polymerase sigma factor [Myxococcota bacterium]